MSLSRVVNNGTVSISFDKIFNFISTNSNIYFHACAICARAIEWLELYKKYIDRFGKDICPRLSHGMHLVSSDYSNATITMAANRPMIIIQ